MRGASLGIVCIAGALLSAPAFAGALGPFALERAKSPKIAPQSACRSLTDSGFAAVPAKGPVIVHFWASWCAPCRAELPMLVAFAHRYRLRLDLVSVDRNPKQARALLRALRIHEGSGVRLLWDASGSAHRRWHVRALPTSYFVAQSGRLVARAIGARNWQDPALAQEALAALQEEAQ